MTEHLAPRPSEPSRPARPRPVIPDIAEAEPWPEPPDLARAKAAYRDWDRAGRSSPGAGERRLIGWL